MFWHFTVWINCSSDLKKFANHSPSAKNYKSFSRSLEQFFLTVGQNNFGNKIPFFWKFKKRLNNAWVLKKSYRFLSNHTECNIWDRQNKEQEQECAPMLLLYSSMTPLQYALENCTHRISGYWFYSRSLRFWENNYCYKLSNWQNDNYFHSKWQLRPFWVK